jgi:2-dehydro-3-deoxygluconokinase
MVYSQGKSFSVLGFGEVMLRLSPQNKERISLSETFEKHAGGSELNVVSGISMLGMRTGMITKLPDNEIGGFIKNKIRYSGVSDDYIIYDKTPAKRLGIYYYETGAHPRKPSVVYDRASSSITGIALDEIPDKVFDETDVFHVSGISLALTENVRHTAIALIKRFKSRGVLISFDVNYRATLWDEETARETIGEVLKYVDILFVSEETSRRMLRKEGSLEDIMKGFATEYGCRIVATTLRKVTSPTLHDWNSKIYSLEDNKFFMEEPYKDIQVVDRIGSGDAYLAGVLFGLLKYSCIQKALETGNAMAAVKNTILGDMPGSDLSEIESVIKSHKSTGVQDEMKR